MSSSENDWPPSPRPVKKRRVARRVDTPDESPDENANPAKAARRQSKLTDPKSRKPQKLKYRINDASTSTVEIQDIEATQRSCDPPSSPWRVRGAIWIKQKPPPQLERPPQTDSRNVSAITPLASPTRAIPVRQSPLRPISRAAPQDPRRVIPPPDSPPTLQTSASQSDNEVAPLNQPDPLSRLSTPPISLNRLSAKDLDDVPPIPTDDLADLPPDAFDDDEVDGLLADLPSDAFSSPSPPPSRQKEVVTISSQDVQPLRQVIRAPLSGLHQTTLYGESVQGQQGSQARKRKNFVADARREPPTHHVLNTDALEKYIYPTNLGTFRNYQFSIVKTALHYNTLVALPTGLGKTFIAATVMLNWYRWTKDAQIVFVAPTKPLVAQQVNACFHVAGIPKSHTSMLTGEVPPGLRAEAWRTKRVFFMTPQTITNDLKTGICDPKRVVLLVVDEAHRATGGYAYVEVVKIIRQFNPSFRILALTATPGNTVEGVQQVIDGLDIAEVEIRTEFSMDIREYVHSRKIDRKVFDNSDEMLLIMELFSSALKPVVDKLNQQNAYWSRDPMALTAFGLTQARQKWNASPAGRGANMAVKGMVNRMFAVLASLAHAIDLLKYHGIGPFYHNMINFQQETATKKAGKYENEILQSESFGKMMSRLRLWVNDPRFIGHPKLEYLQAVVLEHFQHASESASAAHADAAQSTRIMIFAHFRDSAEEIVRILKRQEPMIRPHVFVGQAASKGGSEGMDQKKQLQVIQDFRNGKYNTLVATSIGEEGLDIGEVDLIVCYDSSASPIRMLQRMGRTGRKRAGNIVLLLMRGKEENSFISAKDNYEKMQTMIADGNRFSFPSERSPRILPFECRPEAERKEVDIPVENNQDELPVPKKQGKIPKRPPKKFHMPDGVRTGFVTASRLNADTDCSDEAPVSKKRTASTKRKYGPLQDIPDLKDCLLSDAERRELSKKYTDVAEGTTEIIQTPEAFFSPAQRWMRPTALVSHSRMGERLPHVLSAMHEMSMRATESLEFGPYGVNPDDINIEELCGDIDMPSEKDVNPQTNKPKPKPKSKVVSKPPAPPKPKKSGTMQPKTKKAPPKGASRARKLISRDDVAEEGGSSSPAPTPANMALPSQGISLGSDTSGQEEDEEEADSDLERFINDDEDDEELYAALSSSPPFGKVMKRPDVSDDYSEDDDDEDAPFKHFVRPQEAPVTNIKALNSRLARSRKVVEDSSTSSSSSDLE